MFSDSMHAFCFQGFSKSTLTKLNGVARNSRVGEGGRLFVFAHFMPTRAPLSCSLLINVVLQNCCRSIEEAKTRKLHTQERKSI